MSDLRQPVTRGNVWKGSTHMHGPALSLNLVKGLLTDSLGLWFQDLVYQTIECFFVGVQARRGLSAGSHPHPVALADPRLQDRVF